MALDVSRYMDDSVQKQVVTDMLAATRKVSQFRAQINAIYSDPSERNPAKNAAGLADQLDSVEKDLARLGPMAEAVLQEQVSAVIADLDLSLGGSPIPALLYHATPLPYALIISPREIIRQEANISLLPELTVAQMVALEQAVENAYDVSALVEPVGGIGTYPTMVMRTDNMVFLTDVISHEWIHNYLTLRPLGINYETTPQLRTMNETTASIAGKEIGEGALSVFFPEYLPKPITDMVTDQNRQAATNHPVQFNFPEEMRVTRLVVDSLLAEKRVDEAEQYMETRRQQFWENGYRIRRLNQAYFAFHGAYASEPGGAAGQDPVGPAVRKLREQSGSLAAFVNRISWMTSVEQLYRAVNQP